MAREDATMSVAETLHPSKDPEIVIGRFDAKTSRSSGNRVV